MGGYGRLKLPGAHSQIWANHFYGGFVAWRGSFIALIGSSSAHLLLVSNDRINIYDPWAPGSHGQISTNHFIVDLHACEPLMALIGRFFRIVVPTLFYKDAADRRDLFYENVIDLISDPLYQGLCCEMGLCESVPRRTIACICLVLCRCAFFSPIYEVGNK
jgi:hypothetical protein